MPEWLIPALGIVGTILGGLGILGKFLLAFIEAERSRNAAVTSQFIEHLRKQAEETTQERVKREETAAAERQSREDSMRRESEMWRVTLADHTDQSKTLYHQNETIANALAAQNVLLKTVTLKLQELIEVVSSNNSNSEIAR